MRGDLSITPLSSLEVALDHLSRLARFVGGDRFVADQNETVCLVVADVVSAHTLVVGVLDGEFGTMLLAPTVVAFESIVARRSLFLRIRRRDDHYRLEQRQFTLRHIHLPFLQRAVSEPCPS